jgi:UPF0755 protein
VSFLKKSLVLGATAVLLAAIVIGTSGYYWATRALTLAQPELDISIKPGSGARSIALQLDSAGVPVEPRLFVAMTRLLGLQNALKSGNYAFKNGVTPYDLLRKLARGDVNESAVTVIEGWSLKRMRIELDANAALKHDTLGMSDANLLKAIGVADTGRTNAEGLFFPDTYLFDKGTSDLNIYRRAYTLMQQRLTYAWLTRAPNLPYKSSYEALVMASLIEKETGKESDRPLVAAVFNNRLRIGMPLQTDPTVIYGMGDAYAGRLRKHDLLTDTPYNTYTRAGLPPTPIALPGAASLQAALNPATTSALYFVSRGDGSSQFSDTLDAHNKAVDKYIRGQ